MTPTLRPRPRLLYLLSFWPRRAHSAASERIFCNWHHFKNGGYDVVLAADGPVPEDWDQDPGAYTPPTDVQRPPMVRLKTNDPDGIKKLHAIEPQVVLFDKYTTEEKYSWQVCRGAPEALRILDTVDLHWLRKGRDALCKKGAHFLPHFEKIDTDPEFFASLNQVIEASGDHFLREMAAILRSDLTLVVSDVEKKILSSWNFISPEQVVLQTLGQAIFSPQQTADSKDHSCHDKRQDFYFVGHYHHPPNRDAIAWLKSVLWPMIRAQFIAHGLESRSPEMPRMHIFSAGMTPTQRQSLDHRNSGFWVHGPVEKIPLNTLRVNLAPLRSGAGIKGKIAEGWSWGLPVVTTPVGAEGMFLSESKQDSSVFGGLIAQDEADFARKAHFLYTDPHLWQSCQRAGQKTLETKFCPLRNQQVLLDVTASLLRDLPVWRRRHLLSSLLAHESLRSTEYFSRWIQLKNELRPQENSIPLNLRDRIP